MSPQSDTPTRLGGQPRQLGDDEARLASLLGDNFELLGPIGSGGMGTVYKAHHKQFDQVVAVKVVRSATGSDANLLKRLKVEAQALASLQHESIVRVLNLQLLDGIECALVMEYVTGRDLSDIIENESRLSPGRCRKLMIQCAQGLAHAHEYGVIHRDLKPGNILVTTDADGNERAKILDFGLAKLSESGDQKLTRTGVVMGSPAYMSPEQCQARGVDARSDIYSLGCVFYHALTGKQPFEGDSAFEVLYQHANERVPDAQSGDAALDAVIAKCTESAEDDRFLSAGEMLDALRLPSFRCAKTPAIRVNRMAAIRASTKKHVILIAMVGLSLIVLLVLVSSFNHSKVEPDSSAIRVNWAVIEERFLDCKNNGEVPSVELMNHVKSNPQWLLEPPNCMVVAEPFYNAARENHQDPLLQASLRDEARHYYELAIKRFHELPTPVPSQFEAPRLAMLLLDEGKVSAARDALMSELKWIDDNKKAHKSGHRLLLIKTYLDLLAIDSIKGDKQHAAEVKRTMRALKISTKEVREALDFYGWREVLLTRALNENSGFKQLGL